MRKLNPNKRRYHTPTDEERAYMHCLAQDLRYERLITEARERGQKLNHIKMLEWCQKQWQHQAREWEHRLGWRFAA